MIWPRGSVRYRFHRQLLGLVGLTFLVTVLAGFVIYQTAAVRLVRDAKGELRLLMELRISSIEQFLETNQSEVLLWSDHGPPREALFQFSAAWSELGPDAAETLRRLYIEQNPLPADRRGEYDRAPDRSTYSSVHASVHPAARRFLNALDYHDVFIIDAAGNVIYTYSKEADFGTNLDDGPWKDTDLAAVYREARAAGAIDDVAFNDFRRYEPSHDEPASFIASPVHGDSGEFVGVLAMQISSGRINEEMQFTAGMGETGETYIVGDDFLMRSDSRFSEGSTILVQEVDTETVRRALNGESGVDIVTDYRGVESVSAYGFLDFQGVRWAVMAEIDLEEVLRPARRLRRNLFFTGLAVLAFVALAGAATPPPLTRNQ